MITLIVASVIGSGRQQVLDAGFRLVIAVFSLQAAGFMFGYLGGQLLIGQILTSRTISIEVGMQNSGLGVILAQQNFASPLVAIPSAISSVFPFSHREPCRCSLAHIQSDRGNTPHKQ